MVTKEMWVDWKNNPVTQQYLKDLHTVRVGKLEEIGEGVVTGEALLIEIGRTQGLRDSIEYALRGFNYMEIESDHVGSGSIQGSPES